jgi:hypothetical protein
MPVIDSVVLAIGCLKPVIGSVAFMRTSQMPLIDFAVLIRESVMPIIEPREVVSETEMGTSEPRMLITEPEEVIAESKMLIVESNEAVFESVMTITGFLISIKDSQMKIRRSMMNARRSIMKATESKTSSLRSDPSFPESEVNTARLEVSPSRLQARIRETKETASGPHPGFSDSTKGTTSPDQGSAERIHAEKRREISQEDGKDSGSVRFFPFPVNLSSLASTGTRELQSLAPLRAERKILLLRGAAFKTVVFDWAPPCRVRCTRRRTTMMWAACRSSSSWKRAVVN